MAGLVGITCLLQITPALTVQCREIKRKGENAWIGQGLSISHTQPPLPTPRLGLLPPRPPHRSSGSPVPRCGSAPPHDPDGKASARARRQAAPRALVPSKPWEDEYNPDEVDAVVGASLPREAMSEWKEASSAPRPRPRYQVPLRLQSSHATPAPAPRRCLR